MAEPSIFDVSPETRKKASEFFSGDLFGGALAAAGTAAGGMAAGRPVAPGYSPEQTPRATPSPAPEPQRSTEGYGGATEPGETDENELAAAELARRQQERARMMQEAMSAGGAAGGGYKPQQVELVPTLKGAYEKGLAGIQDVQGELKKFQESPERAALIAEESARLQKAADAEQARMTRLEGLGVEQKKLADETGRKVEAFKVDPDRLFGQGGQRAMTNFSLGIANILSNLGEAMQGKAGTNAILSFVRDRVSQDIALQENDYQRMLQGYNVRRNGLMDAVQQIGNERAGAEALAKQQGLVYADKVKQIARGLEDSQARNTLTQAAAEIEQKLGVQEQRVSEINIREANRAKAQAAAQAAANSRAIVQQRLSMIPPGIGKEDQSRIEKQLDEAVKKGLHVRTQGLRELRAVVEKYPNAAAEARGILGSFFRAVSEEKDQSTLERLLASAAQGQMSDGARRYIEAYSGYIGPRIRSLAGANVTPGERVLYDPEKYSSPQSIDLMMARENKRVRDEAEELVRGSGLAKGSEARLWLQSSLYDMYGGQPKEPPKPEYATSRGKPIR